MWREELERKVDAELAEGVNAVDVLRRLGVLKRQLLVEDEGFNGEHGEEIAFVQGLMNKVRARSE